MIEEPPRNLDHLVDTDVPDPPHGYVLTWDEPSELWIATPGAGAAMLTDDADPLVFLTTEDDSDYLVEG